ncbi:MAG: dihydrofolate reductase [Candidatus Omnitrophica bacterium]|nr:dihydrofolate reductase [Candidatus Omnitrophota bacterium]
MKNFAVILAVDEKMGLGKGNALPWRLSRDMQRFREVTIPAAEGKLNAVVMGRRTWESLPAKFRPLPGRINVVLSAQTGLALPDGVSRAGSLDEALVLLTARADVADIFIIGGGVVFAEAVQHPACNKIYLTRIAGDFSCDVFFAPLSADFKLLRSSEEFKENSLSFQFQDFERL